MHLIWSRNKIQRLHEKQVEHFLVNKSIFRDVQNCFSFQKNYYFNAFYQTLKMLFRSNIISLNVKGNFSSFQENNPVFNFFFNFCSLIEKLNFSVLREKDSSKTSNFLLLYQQAQGLTWIALFLLFSGRRQTLFPKMYKLFLIVWLWCSRIFQ